MDSQNTFTSSPQNSQNKNTLKTMIEKVEGLFSRRSRVINSENISNLDKGAQVISSANKFVLTIPKTQGEPLIDPKTNKPITDWQGNPIGESGVVFYNAKDNATQAVPTDGTGVIIINEVNEEQSEKLKEKILSLAPDPTKLTLNQIKEILEYAQNELGLKDMYNSDNGFISKKMSSVGIETRDENKNLWGRLKRDDRDICQAVLVHGPITFEKESEGQGVVKQEAKGDAVLVKQGDDIRLIQLDVFLRTYKTSSGETLTPKSIPEAEYQV